MSHDAPAEFDARSAHRHFSADCFNRAWTLVEKPDRSAAETEAMVLCALASLWHWTQRPDCTDRNLSIGHWQVSRVYALAGQGENALRHARRSLALADGAPPFYVGYAHEAVARAARALGDRALLVDHLNEARRCAAAVTDAEERRPLEQDLQTLETPAGPAASA
jgi:hypothetical protein